MITFDIETHGLGGSFIEGAIFDGSLVSFFASAESLLDAIILRAAREETTPRNPLIAWAHNGGEYDLFYLTDLIREKIVKGFIRSARIRVNGNNRIIAVTVTLSGKKSPPTIDFRDSLMLLPMSLKRLTASFSETQKGDIGLDAGHTYDPATDRDYLRSDVVGLYEGIQRFEHIVAENFQVPIKTTLPATAIGAVKATIPSFHGVYRSKDEDAAFREAYRGGICFLRSTARHENVITLDRNAHFADAMRALPLSLDPASAGHGIHTDSIFIAYCHVRCEPGRVTFPFLSTRLRKGQTAMPYGEFSGWYTSIEIFEALRRGYEIDVTRGYYWPLRSCHHYLAPFVDRCEKLEISAKSAGDTALRDAVKLLRNSAYGKFGSAPSHVNVSIAREAPSPSWMRMTDHAGLPVDDMWESEQPSFGDYMLPHWAAFITAQARVNLVRAVYAAGVDNVFYGDTDSITGGRDALLTTFDDGIGDHYGQWKIEHEWDWFQAVAPKTYFGLDHASGEIVKAKGMPATHRTHVHMSKVIQKAVAGAGHHVDDVETHRSMLLAIRDGGELFVKRRRGFSQLKNAAGWREGPNGAVIPVDLRELRQEQEERHYARLEIATLRDQRRQIRSLILATGGIRPDPDYSIDNIPRSLRRRAGLFVDDMAARIGPDLGRPNLDGDGLLEILYEAFLR